MDPQDDPEARIRALEQPLSDAARTSELGTSPYAGSAYPPPLPPPLPPGSYGSPYPPPSGADGPPYQGGYGAPYPGAPTPNKGRGGQFVLALIAVAVVAVAVGLAVFMFTGGGSRDTPATPRTSSGAGGTVTGKPSEPDNGGPIATLVPVTPTAPRGERVSVSGVGEDKTIECNESIVSVSGVSNTVVITGRCASLTVSGIKNHVTVDAAETIAASGIDNRVVFHFGSPQIENSGGSNNTVDQG